MISLVDEIVKGCEKQYTKAQMRFYELFYRMVYNCCYRILLQKEESEDAMQESFLKAFEKIKEKGDAPIEAWLRRIAINTAIDKLKKKAIINS